MTTLPDCIGARLTLPIAERMARAATAVREAPRHGALAVAEEARRSLLSDAALLRAVVACLAAETGERRAGR